MAVIIADNIGKMYRKYHNNWDRIKDWLMVSSKKHSEEIWVLKNIHLRIYQGESVGIIGQNGAGKSTLLKLLTGTTKASTGTIQVHGRISALLELGMGFHPEFTGRQNAIMACQLQGLAAEEIDTLMPAIEDFAEIGTYIDEPIRTYSSGMVVRLAFAAATVIRPEVLIIDEALSVGDIYFQHKCFERIKEFNKQGTTLLFVSHDPGVIKSLCNRAIMLEKGSLTKVGSPEEVLDYYNAIIAQKEQGYSIEQESTLDHKISTRSGGREIEIKRVDILSDQKKVRVIRTGQEITLAISLKYQQTILNPTIGFMIKDRLGNEVFGTNTAHLGFDLGLGNKGDLKEISFKFIANLGTGSYSITVAVHEGVAHVQKNYDWWDYAGMFEIVPGNEPGFVGVCYLPVKCEKI